ncbi:Dehydroquinate synthase-like protein [Acephala macrosclerotiorum]|nr:Dehydroquinate synthase-like protein [Acephala macrosclerotiorum]
MATQETLRPTFPHATDNPYPRLTRSSFLRSLKTNFLTQLQEGLGKDLVGIWIGIKAHTPLDDLLPIVEDMRTKKADCLITLGGGSLSDGGKAITYALANDISTKQDFIKLGNRKELASAVTDTNAPSIPLICITISLSGGEHSHYAGVTDPKSHLKIMYTRERASPPPVVLDAQITVSTPKRPASSAAALEGLSLLVNGLLKTRKDPSDLDAKLQSNREKQEELMMVLCREEAVKAVLNGAGLHLVKADLGDVLRAVFNALGMPKSLKEVGVGREKLNELAENSLEKHFCHTNPIPLNNRDPVSEHRLLKSTTFYKN